MRYLLSLLIVCCSCSATDPHKNSFFQAKKNQPHHLSVGAVLFNDAGRIACHHFKEIFGQKDIYILMRETMQNDETPLMTLKRGLKEEFGATGEPLTFLGSLSGYLPSRRLPFEKTTLYVACQLVHWDPRERDPEDPEASSTIEWLEPEKLIAIMQAQGKKFARIDMDESEMVKRAVEYLNKFHSDLHSNK